MGLCLTGDGRLSVCVYVGMSCQTGGMAVCLYECISEWVCVYVRMGLCLTGDGRLSVWVYVGMDLCQTRGTAVCLYGCMWELVYVRLQVWLSVWVNGFMSDCRYGHLFVWIYVGMCLCVCQNGFM